MRRINPTSVALAHPERLSADLNDVAPRKAAELMAFVGIRPGPTVPDLYSCGGYSSELASLLFAGCVTNWRCDLSSLKN